MITEVVEAVSPSLDGHGGQNADGKPGAKPAHRYIYYRLYTKDGALESNNPIYSNDRFISRVVAKYVAPPHTAASIKRHLCRIEGFESPGNGGLYLSLSEKTVVEDSARLSLRGNTGPGSSETEPMVLIVEISAIEKRSPATTVDSKTLPERREEPCYLYYRVYDQDGQVTSKTSFNENESSLGRIDTLSIPPPHSVSSLMSRLVKIEGISSRDVQLFEDEYGESIMNDADAIAVSSDKYPGMTEDEPVAIVYESQKSTRASKVQDSPPQAPAFSKQIKVLPYRVTCGDRDPAWHEFSTGDIFKTDGILRMEKYVNRSGIYETECYVAINLAGKKAFIETEDVKFC